MRKIYFVVALTAMFSMQTSFANHSMESSACGAVAKACVNAGFAKKEHGKKFWSDCMKPIILGQSVKGVNIDPATVKTCRTDKIAELQKELSQLQSVK